ncbi:MAG: hypothetical protein EXR98_07575 [Gemmataceae bacterium]|nr:hypothetical protein [Gemmataceae bacterium]
MTAKIRYLIVGTTLVAMLGLAYLSAPVLAGEGKDIPATVRKIAEMIKKKDDDGVKKTATAAAKNIEELPDLMHMFRPRNKGGLGIGEKPMANPTKDGLEVYLRDLARDVPATIAKQSEALETSGYWIAAMAELGHAKAPTKNMGKKTIKAWTDGMTDMRAAGIAFAKAATTKGAQEIKTAAAKVNATCNNCHSVFKD